MATVSHVVGEAVGTLEAGLALSSGTFTLGCKYLCGKGVGQFDESSKSFVGRLVITVNGVKVGNDATFGLTYSLKLSFDVVHSSAGRARRLDVPIRRGRRSRPQSLRAPPSPYPHSRSSLVATTGPSWRLINNKTMTKRQRLPTRCSACCRAEGPNPVLVSRSNFRTT
jgi:hypothetical protein